MRGYYDPVTSEFALGIYKSKLLLCLGKQTAKFHLLEGHSFDITNEDEPDTWPSFTLKLKN